MYLLDTNVVSHFIRRDAHERTPVLVRRVEEIIRAEGLALSAVTLYELRRGLNVAAGGRDRAKAVRFEKLLRTSFVLGLDQPDFTGWDVAAGLWAAGQRQKPALNLQEGDLLIAATALHHRRILVTCEAGLAAAMRTLEHGASVELLATE